MFETRAFCHSDHILANEHFITMKVYQIVLLCRIKYGKLYTG